MAIKRRTGGGFEEGDTGPFALPLPFCKDELVVEGLRQNNLKNLCVRIPHNGITTIVGPSGSGKSSLAFDTLFAEGRWRFMESLSTYTRLFLERMDRPELDSIRNIRPAIAVEQRNPVRTSRSTVGTATEINDYLRLLFARVGVVHCPGCAGPVKATSPSEAADKLLKEKAGDGALIGFTLPLNGKTPDEALSELLGKGFTRVLSSGNLYNISYERPSDESGEVEVVADRVILKEEERSRVSSSLEAAYREGGGSAWALVTDRGGTKTTLSFSISLRCPLCLVPVEKPTHISLSFNHPVGACAECKGFGNILRYDMDKIVPDKTLSLNKGAIEPWTKPAYRWWFEEMKRHSRKYGIEMDRPFSRLTEKDLSLVMGGTPDFDGIDGFFDYLETKKYKLHIKVFTGRYKGQFTCPACGGARLKKGALQVKLGGKDIAEVSAMTIGEASSFFGSLRLTAYEKEVSKEVLRQVRTKLEFLNSTGLGYITLDRLTKTLSGGEAQRVQIATQLASSLTGVLYILDEPSIGLHPVDIDMLCAQMKRLSSRGNTVVVVEHDPSIIKASDNIVELGPGAGERGGRLVYSGPYGDFISNSRTLTSDYLTGREVIHTPRWRRNGSGRFLVLKGASGNNLKTIDMKIPLRTLTSVTGVSGSGKSTLVVDTLYNILAAHFGLRYERALQYSSIEGLQNITGVKLVDQGPIGRTPRSNPVTYIGGFDHIRRFFSELPRSRSNGLTPSSFSFNIPGGRCEACKGEGVVRLEMYFLPDIYIKCSSCGGKRFKQAVLDVRHRGKNIHNCLEMTFDEAAAFFPDDGHLQRIFQVLKDVGLGYLRLGQSALTLSGGEAQRLKVAKELVEGASTDILYIFDEPTTGLHMDDTKKLLCVLGRLVDSGNTVLLIEHNLDCIKTADHIIDLGPGGGSAGGRVVASGTPESVARVRESHTGRYLREALSRAK